MSALFGNNHNHVVGFADWFAFCRLPTAGAVGY